MSLERIYWMEGFDAAEWRSEWAEMFDPFESAAPDNWREKVAVPR